MNRSARSIHKTHWTALAKEARIRPCRSPNQNRFICAASMPLTTCGGFMRYLRSRPCSEKCRWSAIGARPARMARPWCRPSTSECGGGPSVRAAGACQAEARLRCSGRKAVIVWKFFGDFGSACDDGSICSGPLMSDRANRNQMELFP